MQPIAYVFDDGKRPSVLGIHMLYKTKHSSTTYAIWIKRTRNLNGNNDPA